MSTYNDASLIYYPSGYKASKAYSLKPTDGSGDLTFTRASSATRVNEQGLIEGVRTNLLSYSEQFDNAYWLKSLGTLTANSAISPDGTTTAEKWEKTSGANSLSRVYRSTSPYSSTGVYTYSVFLKNIDSTSVLIRMDSAGNTASLNFDWVSATGSGANVINVGFDDYGNGWSRVWITSNVISTAWSLDAMVLYADVAGKSLYFWGAQLEASASATEYIPTTTTAVSVGITNNVPRIDYTGGGCGKLLLEPQRSNLALYSEQFDNASWFKENVTITSNNIVSPSGLIDADMLVENSSTAFHGFRNTSAISATVAVHTFSIFLKTAGRRYANLTYNTTGSSYVNGFIVDLQDGVITQTVGTFSVAPSVQNYGNGWFRVSYGAALNGGSFAYVNGAASSNSLTTAGRALYLGSGSSSFYVWGAQLEAGSYPTSYIPTTSTAVTRVADNAYKIGITPIIGQTEGVMFIDFVYSGIADTYQMFKLSDGTSANRLQLYINTSHQLSALSASGGATQFAANAQATLTVGTRYKMCLAYKLNDYAIYLNGTSIYTNVSSIVPATLTEFTLNNSGTSSTFIFYNKVQSTLLFQTRLPNAELAALTTL